jgi:hypothetical protein
LLLLLEEGILLCSAESVEQYKGENNIMNAMNIHFSLFSPLHFHFNPKKQQKQNENIKFSVEAAKKCAR